MRFPTPGEIPALEELAEGSIRCREVAQRQLTTSGRQHRIFGKLGWDRGNRDLAQGS
jgi:hypothetical protein